MDENKVIGKEIPKFSAKDVWQLVMDHGASDFEGDLNSCDDIFQEFEEIDRQKIEHFGGYIVKRGIKFISASCEECSSSIKGENAGIFSAQKNTFHALNILTKKLIALISYLEKTNQWCSRW